MERTRPTMMRRVKMALCALVVLLVGTHPAAADEPIGLPLRLGLVGGVHLTSSQFDVMGERTAATQPQNGGLVGLRVGWRTTRAFGLELTTQLMPSSTAADGSALLMPIHLDAVVRPLAGVVQPYASAGTGFYTVLGGDAGSDADALFRTALGVEVVIDRGIGIRLEGALYLTDGVDDAVALSPAIMLGVDILAWRERDAYVPDEDDEVPLFVEPPPVPEDDDRDDDDVDDDDDLCPFHAGLEDLDGCPDSDEDGLRDAWDRCPTRAGKPETGGCPDTDYDGLVDREDACPKHAGPVETYGCPGK